MKDSSHRNKIRKSYELKKDEKVKFNITLDKQALKNYEDISEKLAYKSLSSAVRRLLQFATDNIELFTKVGVPISKNLSEADEILQQILDKRPYEIEQQESRFVKLESTQEEILNRLDKLTAYFELKDKENFSKVKSTINGLDGKVK